MSSIKSFLKHRKKKPSPPPLKDTAHSQLSNLFPTIDRLWLSRILDDILEHKASTSASTGAVLSSEVVISQITHKLLDLNFGQFPQGGDPSTTSAKNDYLKTLRTLFPDIDLKFLRGIVQKCEDDVVSTAVDRIIEEDGTRGAAAGVRDRQSKLKSIFDSKYLRELAQSYEDGTLFRVRVSERAVEGDGARALGYPQGKGPRELLGTRELFRTEAYKKGCEFRLCNKFPSHWSSTIKAVMEENNYDYGTSLEAMERLPTSYITEFFRFLKRKAVSDVSMFDLDLLFDVESVQREKAVEAEAKDWELAKEVNAKEYELAEAFVECQCCFEENVTFEDVAQCNSGSHLFCRSCVERYIKEGLYGDGSLRGAMKGGVDTVLPCLVGLAEGCGFSLDEIQRCVDEETFANLYWPSVEEELQKAGLILAQCPFCRYSEVEEVVEVPKEVKKVGRLDLALGFLESVALDRQYGAFRKDLRGIAWCLFLITGVANWPGLNELSYFMTVFLCCNLMYVILSFICILAKNSFAVLRLMGTIFYNIALLLSELVVRTVTLDFIRVGVSESSYPRVFQCKDPNCLRWSCRRCSKLFRPLHRCYETEVDALRLFVEETLTDFVSRVCPNCSLRFQKLDGCNKVVCSKCKLTMCYICRRDISKELYEHFCTHFRPIAGVACEKCQKCDLYKVEEDARAMRAKAIAAKEEWLRQNGGLFRHKDKDKDAERVWRKLQAFDPTTVGPARMQ